MFTSLTTHLHGASFLRSLAPRPPTALTSLHFIARPSTLRAGGVRLTPSPSVGRSVRSFAPFAPPGGVGSHCSHHSLRACTALRSFVHSLPAPLRRSLRSLPHYTPATASATRPLPRSLVQKKIYPGSAGKRTHFGTRPPGRAAHPPGNPGRARPGDQRTTARERPPANARANLRYSSAFPLLF